MVDFHKKELCVFYLLNQLGSCTYPAHRDEIRDSVDVWDKTYSQRPFLWDVVTTCDGAGGLLHIHPSRCLPGFSSPACSIYCIAPTLSVLWLTSKQCLFDVLAIMSGPKWAKKDFRKHKYRHAWLRAAYQAPGRPLNRALMSCGIDRPSVTVSRWITVSGRGTQKRE